MAWCFAVNEQFGETWHLLRLIMCFSSCEEMLGRWMHKILHLSAPLLLLLFMTWYAKLCFMGCWERLRSKLTWFTHDTFNKKRSSKDRKSSMKTIRLHIPFPVGTQYKNGFRAEALYPYLLFPLAHWTTRTPSNLACRTSPWPPATSVCPGSIFLKQTHSVWM